jgi:serine/threonine-protein kinase
MLLLILGFPVALILAWAFELSPGGIKRTEDAELIDSAKPRTQRRLAAAAAMAPAEIKSLAVLPLANQSGDPGQEYFADGLTEELINRLGQIRPLLVIGRNSSFVFKGKTEDSRAIGETLGVAHLLEGSVRKDGDRVRIRVGLVRAADGSQLWSHSYDRELKDIFAVQEEIATAIGAQLRVAGAAGQVRPTDNLEAYNAFLEGNFYDERRNRDDYFKAVHSYKEAIHLDPNFASAYARLSLAERWFHNWGASGPKEREPAAAAALAHARRAVELGPNLADAHVALGAVLESPDLDLHASEISLKRALEIEPANSLALYILAGVTASLGRAKESIFLCREALALEPLKAAIHFYLGWFLLGLGRLDEAEKAMRQAIDLQPTAAGFHTYLCIVEIERGRPDQALRYAQNEPQASERRFGLALAHSASGDRAAADAALNDMVALDGDLNPLAIAAVHAFRGEADQAFEWLDHAWAVRDPGVATALFDPLLRALRDDPRFAEFCLQAGLPDPK